MRDDTAEIEHRDRMTCSPRDESTCEQQMWHQATNVDGVDGHVNQKATVVIRVRVGRRPG
jgi:hypothetical protein